MANLKEVRVRITSVNSTQQITKAMKMVSAAKLRRAQDAITQMRPYASKLREILENVSASVDTSSGSGVLAKSRVANKVLIVAVTSNRGLAGAFNSNVIRTVNRLLNDTYASQRSKGDVKVFCIGKKGSDFYSKNQQVYAGNRNEIFNNVSFAPVAAVAQEFMDEFIAGKYDEVVVVYNRFKNAAVQNVVSEKLLPISPPATSGKKQAAKDYIFEPSQSEIVLDLIPKAVKTQLYKAVLDSNASEHGARMTAMSKATDNAGELIKDLKLQYNKARQAAITNEILEIVAGAEALNG